MIAEWAHERFDAIRQITPLSDSPPDRRATKVGTTRNAIGRNAGWRRGLGQYTDASRRRKEQVGRAGHTSHERKRLAATA